MHRARANEKTGRRSKGTGQEREADTCNTFLAKSSWRAVRVGMSEKEQDVEEDKEKDN